MGGIWDGSGEVEAVSKSEGAAMVGPPLDDRLDAALNDGSTPSSDAADAAVLPTSRPTFLEAREHANGTDIACIDTA